MLGMINLIRKFIQNVAEITAPVVDLILKEAVKEVAKRWGAEHESSAEVNRLLTTAPALHFPDFSKEFVVQADASNEGVGAHVWQKVMTKRSSLISANFNIVPRGSTLQHSRSGTRLFPRFNSGDFFMG